MQDGEFLDWLSYYQLLKKDFAPLRMVDQLVG
jgi:hypothetical protein